MAIATYKQPKFDPRIYTRRLVTKGGEIQGRPGSFDPTAKGHLTRGAIKQVAPLPGYSDVASLSFLYNPSTVTASYAIDMEVGAVTMFPNPDDTADLNVPINQSVSFSLLFDRTYELWDKQYINSEVGKKGCEVDVIAFKQLVGMTTTLEGVTPSTGSNNNAEGSTGSFVLSGAKDVMRQVRCYVYIGGRNSLTYYGYIDSWDVTYAHWSQAMVPTRCVINLNFKLLPHEANNKKPTGASGTMITPGKTGKQTGFAPRINAPSNSGRAGR